MDKSSCAADPHRKSSKPANKSSKKKGIKVVYISSPMKFQTSAARFRSLVQELTGRDSDITDPSKFSMTGPAADTGVASGDHVGIVGELASGFEDSYNELHKSLESSFEMFDESFASDYRMMESFPGFIPSSLFYD